MLDWILTNLIAALAERKLAKGLAQLGIQPFFEQLAAAAQQSGGTMNRGQLGEFFTDEVLRPSLLYPIKAGVGSAQTGLWIGVVLTMLLPVALMKLLGWILKPKPPVLKAA